MNIGRATVQNTASIQNTPWLPNNPSYENRCKKYTQATTVALKQPKTPVNALQLQINMLQVKYNCPR